MLRSRQTGCGKLTSSKELTPSCHPSDSLQSLVVLMSCGLNTKTNSLKTSKAHGSH